MFALNGALYGAWASRIPSFAESHQLSHANLGLILLSLAAGAILSFPLAGLWSDRIGAVKLTIILAVAYLISFLFLALAIDFSTMLFVVLAILFFGATHGAMDVAMNGWAADSERDIGKPIMPVFHAMWSVGAGLGAFSGVMALKVESSIFMHFMFVCVACFSAFAITRGSEEIKKERHQETTQPLLALPRGALVLIGFIALGAAMGEGAMVDWSAIYMVTIASTSDTTAAYGYSVFSVAMVVVRLSGSFITTLLGPVNTVRVSALLAFIGVLLVVSLPQTTTVLMGFVLMGAGYAIVIPLVFTRAANDPVTPPGLALAGVATFSYGGMLLGPPVIGFLGEFFGLRAALCLLAVLSLLSMNLAQYIAVEKK